jgi:hypothetical protein
MRYWRFASGALLGLSLAAFVAAPGWWLGHRARSDVGVAPTVPAQAGQAGLVERGTNHSDIQVRSARLLDQPVHAPSSPVAVLIPAIGIVAPVVPVGATRSGELQIPSDIRTAGWFAFGPSPGDPGSAVIVGHVDSAAQGQGVFFRLRELDPGATISVRFADGTRRDFRVVGRRSYPKQSLPPSVFERTGEPVLTLITCGGPFDWAMRHYEDNVVVFAELTT